MKKTISILTLSVLTLIPMMASAHGHTEFEINGAEYGFVVGSLNEPVTVDDKTGVDLRITKMGAVSAGGHHDEDEHGAGTPVAGLEETLKVELIAGDKKKTLELSPVYNTPGAYKAPFYPTIATTLSYRVFGTIEGTPFDYTFTCNPAGHGEVADDTSRVQVSDKVVRTLKTGTFGCPVEKAEMGFPEMSASVVELQKQSGNSGMIGWGSAAIALVALAVAFLRRRQ